MHIPSPLRAFLTASALCSLARLFGQSGTLDQSFNASDIGFGAGDGVTPQAPGVVVVQPDDKILIGGNFTRFNTVPRHGLVRLLPDGTLDMGFNTGTLITGYVNTLALQPDGKIIAGGNWAEFLLTRFEPNGTVDPSFNIGLGPNGQVEHVVLQPDGKILVQGGFSQFDQTPTPGMVRLNADGSLDPTFTPGVDPAYVTAITLQPDGKILMARSSFFPLPAVVRLNTNGTVDGTFSVGSGPQGSVYDLLVQPDGKILVSGYFNHSVVRLETDGSLDPSFDTGTGGDNGVWRLVLRADGRILCGGGFATFNGVVSGGIIQLQPDGSVDATFQTNGGFGNAPVVTVYDVAVQASGSAIAIGYFGTCAGEVRHRLARIYDNGTLDPLFHRQYGANEVVNDIDVRADGKIMITGVFNAVNGRPRPKVARLFADGTLDPAFQPDTVLYNVEDHDLVIQPDDKVVVLGQRSGPPFVAYMARLNTDGSIDPTFDVGDGFDGHMLDMVLQPDGKFIVGGDATEYDGVPVGRIVRILPDGAIDPSFNTGTGFSGRIYSLALQPDGKVLCGGMFTSFNGAAAFRSARLNSDGSLDATFTSPVSTVVRVVALRPDGRILVAYSNTKLACLTSTGALDPSFNNTQVLPSGYLIDLATLSSGEIALVGNFSTVLGAPRNCIAVLTADGQLSTDFDPGIGFEQSGSDFPASLWCVAAQQNDAILAGGQFTSYNGIGRNRFARINYEFSTGTTPANELHTDLLLWPNPSAQGTVHVRLPETMGGADAIELRIIATDGRVLRTQRTAGSGDRPVEIAGLVPGSYLLQVRAAGTQRHKLFVVE